MDAERDVAPWIERFARVGFVAKGVLYGILGLAAVAAAFGSSNDNARDTRGAMQRIHDAPFGRLALIMIALGLLGYSVWRFVEGIADPERRGSDAKGMALRASFFARGLLHLGLAWSAARLAFVNDTSGGDGSAKAAGAAFALPAGQVLVWGVAIGMGSFGLYQLYRAARRKLGTQMNVGEIVAEAGDWLVSVSRVGIAARGVVFIAIAWMLATAAREHDPGKAGGIAAGMNQLASLGRVPFAVIGAGLIAYGIYQLLNARYRRVKAA